MASSSSSASKSKKRKRVVLPTESKIAILDQLKAGATQAQLAEESTGSEVRPLAIYGRMRPK